MLEKRKDWAISIEASLETEMNVQRLLNLPKHIILLGVVSMEEVNRNVRRRPYEARDKEILISQIIELHNAGISQVDIAKRLGISRGTILRWNKELNLFQSRPPGEAGKLKCKIYNYDENYFSTIDTPNKAYIVGFITGDGTIFDRKKSKRIVLTLAEQDKQILVDIAKELNMVEAMKFRKRSAPNEQNKYSLVINSTKMCNDLINLGVIPRKTGFEKWYDFKNDELQWAYLRGFFDADGHVRTGIRIGFTSNEQMLYDLLAFIRKVGIGLTIKKVVPKQGCADLYITRKLDRLKLAQMMYAYGEIKLNRKYEKMEFL